jgi:hypothetical protein
MRFFRNELFRCDATPWRVRRSARFCRIFSRAVVSAAWPMDYSLAILSAQGFLRENQTVTIQF